MVKGTNFADLSLDNETFMSPYLTKKHGNIIPAQAGIQNDGRGLDSHSPLKTCGDKFRGNDGHLEVFSNEKKGTLSHCLHGLNP